MLLTTTVSGRKYQFASVKEVLAKAGEEKSGDRLAGIAAASERERTAHPPMRPGAGMTDGGDDSDIARKRAHAARHEPP